MRTHLPFVLAVTLTLGAAGCVSSLPDQDMTILGAPTAAKMQADQLWKEFEKDAAQAKKMYWGKVVEVTGNATRFGTDAPGDRYVLFGQPTDVGVRANLLDTQAKEILGALQFTRRVTLKCYCDDLSTNLILKSCVRP